MAFTNRNHLTSLIKMTTMEEFDNINIIIYVRS